MIFVKLMNRCAEGKVALTYPVITNSIYLDVFHVAIPLTIPDTSKFSLWNLLGLVENQAKLTRLNSTYILFKEMP